MYKPGQHHEINFHTQVVNVIPELLQNRSDSLNLGSHFPFSLQVADLGPMSASPRGQPKVIVFPSNGIPL